MPDPDIALQSRNHDRKPGDGRRHGLLRLLVRWGTTIIEDDGRYMVAKRLASRRIARCAKARRIWLALVAIQAFAYVAAGGSFLGILGGIESAKRSVTPVRRKVDVPESREPSHELAKPPASPPDADPRGPVHHRSSAIVRLDADEFCGRNAP